MGEVIINPGINQEGQLNNIKTPEDVWKTEKITLEEYKGFESVAAQVAPRAVEFLNQFTNETEWNTALEKILD